MKKYLVEFIGTFFLVLSICMSVLGGAGAMAPIVIGAMLMVMIYAGGHISGAHYNPAVTLAMAFNGKISSREIVPYILAQITGGALGSVVSGFLLDTLSADEAVPMQLSAGPALLAEILGTFALVFVIFNVATAKGTSGNSFYGLAIGFTVTACAYVLGGISGGAFNPAVATSISIAGMAAWANIWIYLLGSIVGAILAALAFRFVNTES